MFSWNVHGVLFNMESVIDLFICLFFLATYISLY